MRVTVQEDYPGEALHRGDELVKALTAQATDKPARGPMDEPTAVQRALAVDCERIGREQMHRMVADVQKYLMNRQSPGA